MHFLILRTKNNIFRILLIVLASKQNMLCNIFLGEIYFPKPIQPSNFCLTDCYTEYELLYS